MRTVSEEETLEIIELIQEFGKKLYSKEGAKFLVEAKKFLNKEPCWVEERQVDHFFGAEQICIIGGPKLGLHVMGSHGHHSVEELMILNEAPYLLERISEINHQSDLHTILEKVRKEFGYAFNFPLQLLEKIPIPFVAQSLCEEFTEVDLQVILRTENEFTREHYRNHQRAFQRKHEHYFRSKSHALKTCNVRVFCGSCLARGKIS